MNWGDTRLPKRFWDKVAPCPMSGCWLWTGYVMPNGYGQTRRVRPWTSVLPHRVAYQALVVVVDVKLDLDHKCRVRSCCNPAHLEPVTRKVNVARGNNRAGSRHVTHCKYGHELKPETVYLNKNGGRNCKICTKSRAMASKLSRRRNGAQQKLMQTEPSKPSVSAQLLDMTPNSTDWTSLRSQLSEQRRYTSSLLQHLRGRSRRRASTSPSLGSSQQGS